MQKKLFFIPLLLGSFFLCFLLNVSSAAALTLLPVRLEIKGDPGEVLSQEMTLINDQEKPQTYYSSYMNFEAQGESGTPSFVTARDDVGTWISANDSVTLASNETRTVPITISIPKDATAGGHFGAVFWGTTPANALPGQVAISAKTGMLVLLTVNGDITEAGGLTDFDTVESSFWYASLPVLFQYHFRNDGGDRIKPTGTVTIRNTLFIPTQRLDANAVQGNILPGSTRKFQVAWGPTDETEIKAYRASGFFGHVKYQWKHFALGFYTATLGLSYGSTGEKALERVHFFVFPWQLVIVLIMVLSLLWWGGRALLDRYNRYIIRRAKSILREE